MSRPDADFQGVPRLQGVDAPPVDVLMDHYFAVFQVTGQLVYSAMTESFA
jgi:hypothetical protein